MRNAESRPGLLRWVGYAFGRRLPAEFSSWVWHDLTDADWRLRALLRGWVQIAVPLAAAFALPGPISIRAMTAGILLFGATFVHAAYADELRASRLRRHGMTPPFPRN